MRRGAAHGEERILPFSPAAGKSGKRDVSEQSYQFASASALRKILRESGESGGQKEAGKAAGEYIGKIAAYLPPESAEIFRKEPFFCDMQKMYRLLRYRLLTSDPEHLRTVYYRERRHRKPPEKGCFGCGKLGGIPGGSGHKTLYGGENTPHGGSYSYGSDRGTVSFSARYVLCRGTWVFPKREENFCA